jgi:hypothetical protein
VDLQVVIPRAADLVEGAGAVVHDGRNEFTSGLRNRLASGL